MKRVAVPFLVGIILASGAKAESITLPCVISAPADLVMTFEQDGWSNDGTPWHVSLTRALHIDRGAEGIRLTIGPAHASGKLAEADQRRLAAAFGAQVEKPVTLHLDEQGQVVGVEEMDALWNVQLSRLERLALDIEAKGESSVRARGALKAMTDLDATARFELLASGAGPLLHQCGQRVDGARGAGGIVTVEVRKETAQSREEAHYQIDAASGLVRAVERRVASMMQLNKPQVERWRFDAPK